MTPTNDMRGNRRPAVASPDAFAALFGGGRGARALPRDAARRFLDGARNLPISGVRSPRTPRTPERGRDAASRARRRAARRLWTPGAGGHRKTQALLLCPSTTDHGGGAHVFVCVIGPAGGGDSAWQCLVRPHVRGAQR